MGKVIRLRDDTFRRLQALSEPFITPDTAINVLLDELDKYRHLYKDVKESNPKEVNQFMTGRRPWYIRGYEVVRLDESV